MSNSERDDAPQLSRIASGISGLDQILRGGFLEGGLFIIQGVPGSGKTILGNQICFNHAARGERALYVTLLAENHARMLLHIGQLAFFDQTAIPERIYYISAFRALEEEGLAGLLNLLRREVANHRASVLVLDGLVAAGETARTDREFKKFINELQTQAVLEGCTMFLLTSANGGSTIPPEHTMVDGLIELSSRLYGWRAERHLEILKLRGGGFLRGRHAFRIRDVGIEVFPRIEGLFAAPSRLDQPDRGPVPTGIARLDDMAGGGLPANSTTMLIGPAGVGKTSFGLHFLSEATPEEPAVMLGFFETEASILTKSKALGLPLADAIRKGALEIIWQPTTEGLLDAAFLRLLETVRRRKARRVFIDGLVGIERLSSDIHRVPHMIAALSHEFRSCDVTTLITQEAEEAVGRVSSIPVSGISLHGMSCLAENILVTRFVELRSRLHRLVSVYKMRDHAIDPSLRRFEITPQGISIDEDSRNAEAILSEAMAIQLPGKGNAAGLGRNDGRRGS